MRLKATTPFSRFAFETPHACTA